MRFTRVFEEAPELLAGLASPARRVLALLSVPLLEPARGPWDPPSEIRGQQVIAYLVLDGFVACEGRIAGQGGQVLAGPGDVICPIPSTGDDPSFAAGWRVLRTLRLAAIDAEFLRNTVNHPSIAGEIMRRAAAGHQQALLQVAVAGLRSAQARILLWLTYLAERYGDSEAAGPARVPAAFSHADLAAMTALRRQTATTALGELCRGGWLARAEDGRWEITRPSMTGSLIPG